MLKPDAEKTVSFTSPAELNHWLHSNHSSESELWVKVFKKASGIPSVTWNEIVIESLCWGWIDGLKKSLDDKAYFQRITPRRAGSHWSKRNTEHAERLIIQGRMEEPGLVHVRAAKADGRWDNAYVVSEMTVPADFLAALDDKPEAKQFYETLTKSSRYVIAHGLECAKKVETRQRRFQKFIDMLMSRKKPDLSSKKKHP